MKHKFFLSFILVCCSISILQSCRLRDIEETIYLGFSSYVDLQSEMTYQYMPYTADSAQITFRITSVNLHLDSTIAQNLLDTTHFLSVQIQQGTQIYAESDSLPFTTTFPVFLNADDTLQFVHLCKNETLGGILECDTTRMDFPIVIHKGEIITNQHETRKMTIFFHKIN